MSGLQIEGLIIRYGGNAVVNGFSLEAPCGRATGLIGPNGAGKTTTFNACSGLVRAAEGKITLFGEDISTLRPAARARRGLGRTFQRVELCEQLTVGENVALGPEARSAGSSVIGQLYGGRARRKAILVSCDEALELCGLTDRRDRVVALLSTGERRLVELARAIAARFDMLLLDEPSAGLDTSETVEFGRILKRLFDERAMGILLVEHDMSLVRSVCEYVYVLDFGQPLCDGLTAETLDADSVRNAYLGKVAESA
jgi:ABC-type branched-subunit amino acid transport system ATPase component